MNCSGDQLLASARFSGDQHRGGTGSDLLDQCIDLAHDMRGSYEIAEYTVFSQLAAKRFVLATSGAVVYCLREHHLELYWIDRLLKIVEGSFFLDSPDCHLHIALAGQNYNNDIGHYVADLTQQAET